MQYAASTAPSRTGGAAAGADDGDEVAQVEVPELRGGVVDERVVEVDRDDAAGIRAARCRRLAFARCEVKQPRLLVRPHGLGDDLDGRGAPGVRYSWRA